MVQPFLELQITCILLFASGGKLAEKARSSGLAGILVISSLRSSSKQPGDEMMGIMAFTATAACAALVLMLAVEHRKKKEKLPNNKHVISPETASATEAPSLRGRSFSLDLPERQSPLDLRAWSLRSGRSAGGSRSSRGGRSSNAGNLLFAI